MRLGAMPIWETVSVEQKSLTDMPTNGAPKRVSAHQTRLALSNEGLTQRSKSLV